MTQDDKPLPVSREALKAWSDAHDALEATGMHGPAEQVIARFERDTIARIEATRTPDASSLAAVEVLQPFIELADCYDESEADSHECWMDAGPVVVFPQARKAFTLGAVRRVAALATPAASSQAGEAKEAIAEIIRRYCKGGIHQEPFGGSLDYADLAADEIYRLAALRICHERA